MARTDKVEPVKNKSPHSAKTLSKAERKAADAAHRANLGSASQGNSERKFRKKKKSKGTDEIRASEATPSVSPTQTPSKKKKSQQRSEKLQNTLKIPSYKLYAAKQPITDIKTFYSVYSLDTLFKDMIGTSIFTNAQNGSQCFTGAAANAIKYLIETLVTEVKDTAWDRPSVGKLAKSHIAPKSFENIIEGAYFSTAYMDVPKSQWLFPWLVEYTHHLINKPPPGTKLLSEGKASAMYEHADWPPPTAPQTPNRQDIQDDPVETMRNLLLRSRRTLMKDVGQLSFFLVNKLGITIEELDRVTEKGGNRTVLADDVVFHRLARAVSKRANAGKSTYGLEKIDVSMELTECLVKGWART